MTGPDKKTIEEVGPSQYDFCVCVCLHNEIFLSCGTLPTSKTDNPMIIYTYSSKLERNLEGGGQILSQLC